MDLFVDTGLEKLIIDCPELGISGLAFEVMPLKYANINAQNIHCNMFCFCNNLDYIHIGLCIETLGTYAFNTNVDGKLMLNLSETDIFLIYMCKIKTGDKSINMVITIEDFIVHSVSIGEKIRNLGFIAVISLKRM